MRRWKKGLLFAVVWLTAMGSVRAEPLCVVAEDCAALLAEDGSQIVAPGEFGDVFCVAEGERYALGLETDAGMRYALCDETGALLTESLYSMFYASEDSIIFRQDGLYGEMDFDGGVRVNPEYTQLATAGENGYLAMKANPYDEDADEIFLLTKEGEEIATGVRTDEGLRPLRNDRMPFQDPRTEKFGYIDGTGKVVIEAVLETAGDFDGGKARASVNGKLGLIGVDGEWMILPGYDYLETGGEVTVGLIGREKFVVFDENCREIFSHEGSNLEAALVGGYPVLLDGDVMKVYHIDGTVLLETAADATVSRGAGDQLILADGDWGSACVSVVGEDGVRSGRKDQHLLPLADDRYAFFMMNAAAYFSEELDEIRYSGDYDTLRCGMMDATGNEILPARYLEIRALSEDRFLAVSEEGLSMTDRDGSVLWQYPKE